MQSLREFGREGVGSAYSVLKSYSNPAITSASSGCASRTHDFARVTTQSLIGYSQLVGDL